MSLFSRLANVLGGDRLSRDIRVAPWLDSLRADAAFGLRQLMKRKVTSGAAILSLGLAIGASISAFRLIDALLLRPLPVAHPEELYGLSRQGLGVNGMPQISDVFAYPAFRQMRAAVKERAELIAISYMNQVDLTWQSNAEIEKAYLQYVSGAMFSSFGLRPAIGRLLTGNDDLTPGAHPYAVLSHDYWTRRFGQDPKVVGRTFHMSDIAYEIAGVVDGPFTGTEPGTVTDIFLPTMMNPSATRDDATWIRILARLRPGAAVEPVRARLHAVSYAFEESRAKEFPNTPKEMWARFLAQRLVLEPAASGESGMQRDYRRSLSALAVLAGLVLLIACTNIANLMTAHAAARAREMALRISIGAERWRLIQLVMMESAWLAAFAAAAGAVFAWWSAPFVVSRINPPNNPARLILPADWRVAGFGLALTVTVACLFGLAPALRAGAVNPIAALRGSSNPRFHSRLMNVLIAIQVTFCFVVLFAAALFSATFDRLSHRPLGFSPARILAVDTVAQGVQPTALWDQIAEHLRAAPGIEAVALCGWPLLRGVSQNGFISVNGEPPGPVLGFFLSVSPGWLDIMRIPFVDGRDFHPSDTSPGVAIVNETFVRQIFPGGHPLGKVFAKGPDRYRIVGVVRDAPYRSLREPILPVAYVPFHAVGADGAPQSIHTATLIVRSASTNPLAVASILRREVPRARPEFRVSNILAQADLVRAQSIRERLLAMLAMFFAAVALLLAGIGLYGVLDYSVLQQRREIGIRMAIGARAGHIVRGVTAGVFATIVAGMLAGLVVSMASGRYIEALLYQVNPADPAMLALPSAIIIAAALLAILPGIIHAVQIDPVTMLRSE